MSPSEAVEMSKWTPRELIRSEHLWRYDSIINRAKNGRNIDKEESAFVKDVYRYTNGGGDKEVQPFKQFRRRVSWGVR